MEQLDDALNFAPNGTKELIAETAVKIKLENRDKIALITKKTGKDINDQIKVEEESQKEETSVETGRKAPIFKAESSEKTPAQRKYKIVEK